MIVIPDIHGRSFWKEAVKNHENEEIVFLGDYVDPYSTHEGIKPVEGLNALLEVIEFKKQHPHNVSLLLGNHDLGYIIPGFCQHRHDYLHEGDISRAFKDNKSLFKIAHETTINGKRYIFTHAGIHPVWVEANKDILGGMESGTEVDTLNRLYETGELIPALYDVSSLRGGHSEAGSCVWADVKELWYYECRHDMDEDVFQVFGHTQRPKLSKHFACLDCRRAFILDQNGTFTLLE